MSEIPKPEQPELVEQSVAGQRLTRLLDLVAEQMTNDTLLPDSVIEGTYYRRGRGLWLSRGEITVEEMVQQASRNGVHKNPIEAALDTSAHNMRIHMETVEKVSRLVELAGLPAEETPTFDVRLARYRGRTDRGEVSSTVVYGNKGQKITEIALSDKDDVDRSLQIVSTEDSPAARLHIDTEEILRFNDKPNNVREIPPTLVSLECDELYERKSLHTAEVGELFEDVITVVDLPGKSRQLSQQDIEELMER